MANTILPKRKDSAGSVPADTDLQAGELAVNTADGRLYSKLSNGSVVNLPAQSLANQIVPGDLQVGGETGSITARLLVKSTEGTGTDNAFFVQSSAVTNLLFARNDGTVSVGAINPSARLHVRGFQVDSSAYSLIVTNWDGVQHLTVRDDGRVGINKNVPNANLCVRAGSGVGDIAFTVQSNAGSDVFRVYPDGDTVIGGTLQFASSPSGSAPVGQGTIIFERVSNTSVRLRMRGTDNVLRSATLTLS